MFQINLLASSTCYFVYLINDEGKHGVPYIVFSFLASMESDNLLAFLDKLWL
uniref:Uncharacterized protein n=1 Tax=Rhizophora mucronata TaxID=61149 RepID=A0A2P2R2Z8_RHIMU